MLVSCTREVLLFRANEITNFCLSGQLFVGYKLGNFCKVSQQTIGYLFGEIAEVNKIYINL